MRSIQAIVAKVYDWNIVESVFNLQSRYYVHFRTITFVKGMNPLIPKAMDEKAPLLLL